MKQKTFSVHVINPKAKKRKASRSRKSSRKQKNTMAKEENPKRRRKSKRRSSGRRRRRNPGYSTSDVNPRRRRRSRRRRRNPEGGGSLGIGGIFQYARGFVPRLMGKLFVAFAVRRWGGPGSVFSPGQPTQSPTAGESWTLGQYVVAVIALHLASRLGAGLLRGNRAAFVQGGMDLILTKFAWTEGMARSPWLQQTFGADGDMYQSPDGQLWYEQGGRQLAMNGLVEASPLDGGFAGLVEASPLDGGLGYMHGTGGGLSPYSTGGAATSPYSRAYS